VTDGLVDVALSLTTVRAERHIAPPDAVRVAVEQVPGARRRPRVAAVSLGPGGGGEVDDGDVEMLSWLSVDDPRLSWRATR